MTSIEDGLNQGEDNIIAETKQAIQNRVEEHMEQHNTVLADGGQEPVAAAPVREDLNQYLSALRVAGATPPVLKVHSVSDVNQLYEWAQSGRET